MPSKFYHSKRNVFKQWILSLGVFFFTSSVFATDFHLEPYLGYGQSNLKLGTTIDGTTQGYLLGLRLGFDMGKSLFIAADYSRGGPFAYTVPPVSSSSSSTQLVFNSFATGGGLGINIGIFDIWIGYYPQHTLQEYLKNFRMTGTMTRLGFGLQVSKGLYLNIFRDSHSVKADEISDTNADIFCPVDTNHTCSQKTYDFQTTYAVFSCTI